MCILWGYPTEKTPDSICTAIDNIKSDAANVNLSGSKNQSITWKGWTSYGGTQSASHGTVKFALTVSGKTATLVMTNSDYGINTKVTISLS